MSPLRSNRSPTVATVESAFKAADYPTALAQVDTLLAAGPSPYDRMALLRRGVLAIDHMRLLDRMADAERWSAEVVADPRTAVAVIAARSRVLHHLQRYQEAADAATAAIEFSTAGTNEADSGYLARLKARYSLHDWAGALADADTFTARRGEANHHALQVMAAECIVNLDRTDRLAEADRWTVEALAAGPNVWASNLRAPLLAMTGRLDEAIETLHRSLAEAEAARAGGGPSTPGEAAIHSFLARGYLDRGDLAQSRVHVTAALLGGGDHAVLAGVMARILALTPPTEPQLAPPRSQREAGPGGVTGWERPGPDDQPPVAAPAPPAAPTADDSEMDADDESRAEIARKLDEYDAQLRGRLTIATRAATQLRAATGIVVLARVERYAEADRWTDELVRSGGEFGMALWVRATVLAGTGRADASIGYYTRALAAYDTAKRRPQILERRARTLLDLDRRREALDDYRALRDDPAATSAQKERAAELVEQLTTGSRSKPPAEHAGEIAQSGPDPAVP